MSTDYDFIDTIWRYVDANDISTLTCRSNQEPSTWTFQADRPYDDIPLLPPKEDVETKVVLKACIAARAALAELRVSGQLIPNQAVLYSKPRQVPK